MNGLVIEHETVVHQSVVAHVFADKDRCQRGYCAVEQLAILAGHHGREFLDQGTPLLASEVNLACGR